MTIQLDRTYATRRPGTTAPERLRPRVPARRRPASGVVPTGRGGHATGAVGCAVELAADPGYRLGRWARLSITVTVLLVGLLFATGALPVGSGTGPATTSQVTVHSGDTLWSIAGQAAPGPDTGAVVERIRELNGLDDLGPGAALPVGLELEVPAG